MTGRNIQMMPPLKDLDKKKDQRDPNSLNCSQKESKGKLDTARKMKKNLVTDAQNFSI